ncbi:hypothetical protein XPA_004726 [Xanthoria parietina]
MSFLAVVSVSSSPIVPFLVGVFAAYVVAGVFARLYLSPLANFPGPKLAASTYWPEFYYDLIKGGSFQRQIAQMHEQYGPIVRINPGELHIQDSEFYDQLYRRENKLDKFPGQTKMFGMPGIFFTMETHELHRQRRAPYSLFFSRKAISDMSQLITDRLDALCRRLRDSEKQRVPMPLGLGYVALTTDIISSYALADCYHLLERDDLGRSYHDLFLGFIQSCHFIKHLTFIFNMMQALPDPVILWLRPSLRLAMQLMKKMQSDIQATIEELSSSKTHEPKPGLFSTILQSNLSPQDRTAERIAREAMSLLIAGSETTAFTMSTITYHVLANPTTLVKLRAALRQAIPDPNALPLPLGQLEAIPYLYACVQEGLRLAYGTSNRLTRVSRTPIRYRDWDIPAGVPVGMTTVFMHDDEYYFPGPQSFPTGTLARAARRRGASRKVFDQLRQRDPAMFGLAYAELYITIATIFRRFELALFETERATVEYARDYFNPFPEHGGDGVRVLVM